VCKNSAYLGFLLQKATYFPEMLHLKNPSRVYNYSLEVSAARRAWMPMDVASWMGSRAGQTDESATTGTESPQAERTPANLHMIVCKVWKSEEQGTVDGDWLRLR